MLFYKLEKYKYVIWFNGIVIKSDIAENELKLMKTNIFIIYK